MSEVGICSSSRLVTPSGGFLAVDTYLGILKSRSSHCAPWQAVGMLFAMSRLVEDAMLMFDKTTNRHRVVEHQGRDESRECGILDSYHNGMLSIAAFDALYQHVFVAAPEALLL
ncbi:hypothetical protein AAES_131816 [Amazona aestiva]|uniref:Uncharacterized protein n=1 Tax=Amazona aestiva TaxID=12930 RepID=A0A0Q3PKP7_AMAAE|nr:hypothetical protein AAES_131816 [Amazona aestiva]